MFNEYISKSIKGRVKIQALIELLRVDQTTTKDHRSG